jgi:tyrosine-specific transport protein
MLAMPIQVAEAGIGISAIGLIISWFFMTYTGLLLVEATLWMKNDAHFSSLSSNLIGRWAKVVALIVYLFMNYASLIAYTAGGVGLINQWMMALTGSTFNYVHACIGFTILFGLIVHFGSHFVGKFNSVFMGLLIVAYLGLVGFGASIVHAENLHLLPNWRHGISILPMILATFSYQMVVPTVCSYLNYDAQKLRYAIIAGTALPFITYFFWIFVIHGAIPFEGENGLQEAFKSGAAATIPLRNHLNHWSLSLLADIFAFLALVTSFLGLSLALFDFLKDCFKEMKFELNRKTIFVMSFLPVALLASLYPRALLQFLDISGGYGDTILSGMIPVMMVWRGRYKKKLTGTFTVPGGKIGLICAGAFFLIVLIFQHL